MTAIRFVFISLIVLFLLSLGASSLKMAMLFTILKSVLIGLYFMELILAHRLWLKLYSAVIFSSALVILFLAY